MHQERFEAPLVVRAYNRWILGLLAATGVGAAIFALLGAFGLTSPAPALPILMVALLGGVGFYRRKPASTFHEQGVVIDADSLRIGPRTIPRARVRDAQVVPLKDGQSVVRVWEKARLPLDLLVSDTAQGRAVLRALGFDASQRVSQFRGSSLLMRHWGVRSGVFFVFVLLLYGFIQAFLLERSPELFAVSSKLLIVLIVGGAATLLVPTRVDVGADGVLVRWFGTRRFYPLAQIKDVARREWGMASGGKRPIGVEMTLAGGEVVRLPMGQKQWDDDRSSALVERIREARETHAHGGVEAAAALLVRRERDVHDWIRQLRAIGVGANADLRTAAVSSESLWRIVESHAAQAEDRAAAAVALGPSLDEEGKHRLRVAVDAVADQRLRVAMDAAAREDDEALEEALKDVSGAA